MKHDHRLRTGSLIGALVLATAGCGAPTATPPSGPASSPAGPAPSATGRSSGASPSPTSTASAGPSPTVAPLSLLGALPKSAVPDATAARFQGILDGIVISGSPDVIAAILTRDGRWAGAAGVDGPHGRLAQPIDEFAIASVSKMFVATLVLRLVEQGKMDLDAPLATYLGDMAVDANGATVRQALAMRSGLGDTVDGAVDASLAHCDRALTTAEVLATIPKPFAEAGTAYRYSNPTYKLLHFAAQRVSGRPFAKALQAELLKPVGIDRILLQGPGSSPPKPWALPIEGQISSPKFTDVGMGGTLPCLGFSTLSLGASAIAADAPSLAAWGWQLFAGRIVNQATLAKMATFDASGYGLGLEQFTDFPDETVFGHSGSLAGYAAILAILPERQTVVALFVNNEDADVYAHLGRFIAAIRG
jgi:CubicO group peptidase (beta-lactamase class C family)